MAVGTLFGEAEGICPPDFWKENNYVNVI